MSLHDDRLESARTRETGFLADGVSWTPASAERIARRVGIPELTERHWKVVAQCREDAARRGQAPDARRISRLAKVDATELARLFPGDPAETVARIAGLS